MEIETGYYPGLIGEITRCHARYYSRNYGFGKTFEARVAAGLGEFMPRLEQPGNQIWHVRRDGRFAGSIAIDGEDLDDGSAHLRWFIVEDDVRGSGMGRLLLHKALEFCDEGGFETCVLWTFSGLDAARRLYEQTGFVLAEAWQGNQWGTTVMEQRFVRRRP